MIYNYKYLKNSYCFNNNFLYVNKKYTHSLSNIKKSKVYINSSLNKYNILRENKDKSGIYR
jgi:hypothetical protein